MFRTVISVGLMAVGLSVLSGEAGLSADKDKDKDRDKDKKSVKEKMLAHDVYFTLQDNSPEAKEKLLAACKKYLADHPGTIWFAAGSLAEDLQRDVNVRDFDVALHVVFKNKAAHDRYHEDERHQKFVELMQPNWKAVRVFDSYIDASSHAEMAKEGDRPQKDKRLPLPDPAAGFAGMIRGVVVAKHDAGLVFKVGKILKEWEANKAKDSQSLIGKTVSIGIPKGETDIARFVKLLPPGKEVSLDVAHKGGEALTILELTEEQREHVKQLKVDK